MSSMKLICFLVVAFLSFNANSQNEYVCMPCGQACDKVVHSKPGSCPDCHMKLVLKTSLQFDNLTAEEFCARIAINPNAVLLDVRSAGEFDCSAWRNTYGYFKNAININIDDLENRLAELEKYKDREILVYCSHSVRSPRAAMLLNQHEFKNVKNLAGGVSTLIVKGNACLEKTFVVH